MRSSIISAALLFCGSTALANPLPTVLVGPFEANGDIGHAVRLETLGMLRAVGGLNLVHPKQYARVAERHEHRHITMDEKEAIKDAARVLGADTIVTGEVETGSAGVKISIHVAPVSGGKTVDKVFEGKTLVDAIHAATKGVASQVAGARAAKVDASKVHPDTESEAALLDYAGCHRVLIRQSIGIRTPVLLAGKTIDEAISRCEAALRHDPKLIDAHAALGFAFALKNRRKRAERHLKKIKDEAALVPYYWLGKFWLLSRFHDATHAMTALERAVDKDPGFMLARGYLGDAMTVVRRYDRAEKVFTNYLKVAPKQPWVMARLGYVKSKLKEHDKAIEWTKKALAIAPGDPELKLELASRYVDAGRPKDAQPVLLDIISGGHARGEVHLRLGYVYLVQGDLRKSERQFEAAIHKATHLSEWRTRGRARYDLAKLWMRSGIIGNALREIEQAMKEGFRDPTVFQQDPDFKPLLNHKKFKQLMARKLNQKGDAYLSPFDLGRSAAIDLGAVRRRSAKETVLFRF